MKKFLEEIHSISIADLENDIIESSKKTFLDTLGVLIAGTKEESIQRLMKVLEHHHYGNYSIIGTNKKFNFYTAGLINGSATVAIELDEGNQWSKGHPAAHVIPTMLTHVQTKKKYSGENFLLALIKAYEICSRMGRSTTLLPNAHAHGTWGVIGATASVFLIDNTSPEELYQGINTSASFAMATMWNAALEGAHIRNIYTGQAVVNGLKTADLLSAGIQGPANSVPYVYGEVVGNNFNFEEVDRVAYDWDIKNNYFKEHAFCRYVHAPLDAFRKIISTYNLVPEEIKQIKVHTYSRASTLSNYNYHNALSAKFSIPYALAIQAYTGLSDQTAFQYDYLQSTKIRRLAQKIKVFPSEEMDKIYPSQMPAEVEVKTQNEKIYKQYLEVADTGLGSETSFEVLSDKFKVNTPQLTTIQQEQIINWIANMEEKEDINDLIELIKRY